MRKMAKTSGIEGEKVIIWTPDAMKEETDVRKRMNTIMKRR